MAKRKKPNSQKKIVPSKATTAFVHEPSSRAALLPLGAMLLAGSVGSMAQQSAPAPEPKVLPRVTITDKAEAPEGKDAVQATTTSIGKGNQQLRDIPQSVTVVTEKLIDDRNLNTLRDVLHNTAGVTFQAAEGGEEDIRLRGFSLAQSGDIYLDGMRDSAFYDRDTFNYDRVEVLRGSASMLFGRGSTGGLVNQVSKQARAVDAHELTTTLGSHNFRRIEGDFNIKTGEDAGLRIGAMVNKADNNGAGASIDKRGLALNYRWGIGTQNEISVSLYDLQNRNGINYGVRYLRAGSGAVLPNNAPQPFPASTSGLVTFLDPTTNFAYPTDKNDSDATVGTFSFIHRFADDSQLKTQIRRGVYDRDLRGSAPGNWAAGVGAATINGNSIVSRGSQYKIQNYYGTYVQSDYTKKFEALGVKHDIAAGIDYSDDQRDAFVATSAPTFPKPSTTVGNPGGLNGPFVLDTRVFNLSSRLQVRNLGVYAQDLVQLAPAWKVLAGLRYDDYRIDADYFNTNTRALAGSAQQQNGVWSKRAGVLYQPDDLQTYYASYGSSFNTSTDLFASPPGANPSPAQLTTLARGLKTPPEGSKNFEIGAKFESADKNYTTRVSVFRTIKTNERNTDTVDATCDCYILSSERHAQGMELDIAGRITPLWEVFGSYVWIPNAKIDKASATATTGNQVGDRVGLTALHNGTLWTTYQVTPQLRVGGGINFRSKVRSFVYNPFNVPSFVTGDLMAEYAFSDRYVLKVNVTNITNKLYADGVYTNFYVPGAGRVVQATFTAKF